MELRNAVIVDGVRSPFGRAARGKLVATRLDDVGAQIFRALLDRNPKVQGRMVEDVGLGNVSGKGEFVDLGRVARLAAYRPRFPLSTPTASAAPAWRPCTGWPSP